jgi:hypothetical protein
MHSSDYIDQIDWFLFRSIWRFAVLLCLALDDTSRLHPSLFFLQPQAKSYSFPKASHVQSCNLKLTSLATDQRELAACQFLNILELTSLATDQIRPLQSPHHTPVSEYPEASCLPEVTNSSELYITCLIVVTSWTFGFILTITGSYILYGLTYVFYYTRPRIRIRFNSRNNRYLYYVQRCNRYVELLHLICSSFQYTHTEIRHASKGTVFSPSREIHTVLAKHRSTWPLVCSATFCSCLKYGQGHWFRVYGYSYNFGTLVWVLLSY